MSARGLTRFFFVHVMKTGGTSFADLLRANFADHERYPDHYLPPETNIMRRMEAYMHVPQIVEDVNALGEQFRIVRAHVPYAVRELLSGQFVAMTLLRHPVERTLSYLKHCRHYHQEHAGMALEEIYEDAWFRAMFMDNYQTRIFSMTAPEAMAQKRLHPESMAIPTPAELKAGKPLSAEAERFRDTHPARFTLELFAPCTGDIAVTPERLASARENLSRVELVGVTEHYEDFLRKLHEIHGWKLPSIPKKNVGAPDTVTDSFRRQIASDNASDMVLYEDALARAG
jgi:hypothetical protein